MSKHEVATQRIFHSFCHVLATMEQSSLLEDQNPSLLRLNVYESPFVSSTLENPCSTTFHVCVTQIDLDSNARLSSIWEFELAITMASEVMPLLVTQEAKAFIEAADALISPLLLFQTKGEHTQSTSMYPIHALVDQQYPPIYLLL